MLIVASPAFAPPGSATVPVPPAPVANPGWRCATPAVDLSAYRFSPREEAMPALRLDAYFSGPLITRDMLRAAAHSPAPTQPDPRVAQRLSDRLSVLRLHGAVQAIADEAYECWQPRGTDVHAGNVHYRSGCETMSGVFQWMLRKQFELSMREVRLPPLGRHCFLETCEADPVVVDPTWQQFLVPLFWGRMMPQGLPRVLICRRSELAEWLRGFGFPQLLPRWGAGV